MAPVHEPPAIKKEELRWSDLMQELVEAILMRLPLEDSFHVGLVCKCWWSAMTNVRGLFKPPPLLILNPRHLNKHQHITDHIEAIRFYAICEGGRLRRLSIRLDSFYTNPGGMAVSCRGSSVGWLLMADMDDESRVHLLNPISGVKVELPPLPPGFSLWDADYVQCSELDPDQDFIVAIYGIRIDHGIPFVGLLTCRTKDNRWGEIPFMLESHSATFYRGRLYVSHRDITDIYDFDPDPRKICSVTLEGLRYKELVVMDGKLLLMPYSHPAGTRCSVYELVDSRWVKIQRPCDWVLLRNNLKTQAFSMKESPTLGFEANCLYEPELEHYSLYANSMDDERRWTVPLSIAVSDSYNLSSFSSGLVKVHWFLAQSW